MGIECFPYKEEAESSSLSLGTVWARRSDGRSPACHAEGCGFDSRGARRLLNGDVKEI